MNEFHDEISTAKSNWTFLVWMVLLLSALAMFDWFILGISEEQKLIKENAAMSNNNTVGDTNAAIGAAINYAKKHLNDDEEISIVLVKNGQRVLLSTPERNEHHDYNGDSIVDGIVECLAARGGESYE